MKENLLAYTLHLADNALLLGQRNAEWTGHGPVLEQDIAISNIALDLVGQARNFYQYAATIIQQAGRFPGGVVYAQLEKNCAAADVTEDTLAYLRDSPGFLNCLLVELKKGDWAVTVLRQYFFSAYQFFLFGALQKRQDTTLAAIAEKSLKEVTYHLRWSAEWVIRLGDGTDESHQRISDALSYLWPFTGELFTNAPYETALANEGTAIDLTVINNGWQEHVHQVIQRATLQLPQNSWMQGGGKTGRHTEELGYILAEMQYLQRTYPGNKW